MLVNIEDMSAEQLFELANRKKLAEQDRVKRAAAMERIGEVRKQREQLTREYEQALAANDKAMLAVQKEREQLITRHQAALSLIDKNLSELEAALEAPEESVPAAAAPAPKAAAPRASTPAPKAAAAPAPTPAPATSSTDLEPPYDKTVKIQVKAPPEKYERDEMGIAIMEIIMGRPTISESLLKEQLRTRGYPTADMGKTLERLVREGKITNRGYGNFAAVKKR